MTQSFDDLHLSESDKLDFLNLPVVKNNLANCWFDDQELIMPSGQGRTLKAVVYSALEVFKITIASRQGEIDNLEKEIKETQAFLNNQNHIKQTKIDELRKENKSLIGLVDFDTKKMEELHNTIDELQKRIDEAWQWCEKGCILKAMDTLKGNQND